MKLAVASQQISYHTGRSISPSRVIGLVEQALLLIAPALMFIEVKFIGRLFLTEIIFLIILPFLLLQRGRLLFSGFSRTMLFLGALWLLSQMATDMIIHTPFEDWTRGWSKISFILIDFSAIYLLTRGNERRFSLFAFGLALGEMIAFLLDLPGSHDWKFGYGVALTVCAVLFTQWKFISKRRYLSAAVLASIGVINFYMGYRSMGMICILTMGMVFAKASSYRLNWKKFTVLLLMGLSLLYATTKSYEYAALAGWLGEHAREKYIAETSGDFGVLLGGRSESLVSMRAIFDSPIIGHGSWAKDYRYVQLYIDALADHGRKLPYRIESDLIPSHSFILGAWVESGLAGAVFWAWAFMLTLRALISSFTIDTTILPLIAFIGFNLLWSIPFSPFGAQERVYIAYYICVMILPCVARQNNKSAK